MSESKTGVTNVKYLLRDLRYVEEEEKIQILNCLKMALCENSNLKESFHNFNGVKTVCNSLMDADHRTRYCGLSLLKVASGYYKNKEDLASNVFFEMIGQVLDMVGPCSGGIHSRAFMLISCAMDGNRWMQVPSASNCIDKIICCFGAYIAEVLNNTEVEEDCRSALMYLCEVIRKCCSAPGNTDYQEQFSAIIDKAIQFIDTWMNRSHSKSILTVMNAIVSVLLSILTDNRKNKDLFDKCNGIRAVVKSLQAVKSEGRYSDAVTDLISLLNISIEKNERGCSLAGMLGVMPLLTDLFENLDCKGRERVVECLLIMVQIPDNARALYSSDLNTWESYFNRTDETSNLQPLLEKLIDITINSGRAKSQSHQMYRGHRRSPHRRTKVNSPPSDSEIESSSYDDSRSLPPRKENVRNSDSGRDSREGRSSGYMTESPYMKIKCELKGTHENEKPSRKVPSRSKSLDRRISNSRIPVSRGKSDKATDSEDFHFGKLVRSDSTESITENTRNNYKVYDESDSSFDKGHAVMSGGGRGEDEDTRSRPLHRFAHANKMRSRSLARNSELQFYETSQQSYRRRGDYDNYSSLCGPTTHRNTGRERQRYRDESVSGRSERWFSEKTGRSHNAAQARSRSLARDGMHCSRLCQDDESHVWRDSGNLSRPSKSSAGEGRGDQYDEAVESEPQSLLEIYGHRRMPPRSSYPPSAARDMFEERYYRSHSSSRRGFQEYERRGRGSRGPGSRSSRGWVPVRSRGRGRAPPRNYAQSSSGGWPGKSELVEKATSDSESESGSKENVENKETVTPEEPQKIYEKVPFSKEEDENIRKGVGKYGVNFQMIKKKFKFHAERSSEELFERWKALSP